MEDFCHHFSGLLLFVANQLSLSFWYIEYILCELLYNVVINFSIHSDLSSNFFYLV